MSGAPQCDYLPTGQTREDGMHELRCAACGVSVWLPSPAIRIRGNCDPAARKVENQATSGPMLQAGEAAELFPGLDDPKLLGDWIADLTKAIGIPPCGGCEQRRVWLNKAHALERFHLGSSAI